MKILILSMCNFMGRPASAGDTLEATSPAEMQAAWYLVSIGKAKVLDSNAAVIEVAAKEDASLDTVSRRKTRSLRSSAQEEDEA